MTLASAIGIGTAGYFLMFSLPFQQGLGIGYFFAGPLTQYLVYDLQNADEYFFYGNLGVTKTQLYVANVILNFLIGTVILTA